MNDDGRLRAITQMADDIDSTITDLGNAVAALRRLKIALQNEPDDERRIISLMAVNLAAVLQPLRVGCATATRAEELLLGKKKATAAPEPELSLEQQLQMAIAQENYEEAQRLTDLLEGPNKPKGNPFAGDDNGPDKDGGCTSGA